VLLGGAILSLRINTLRAWISGLETLQCPWAATRALRRGRPFSVAGILDLRQGARMRTTGDGNRAEISWMNEWIISFVLAETKSTSSGGRSLAT
jgi:hypothetical protein